MAAPTLFYATSSASRSPNRSTAATRIWPIPNGMAISHGERAVPPSPRASRIRPLVRYQSPTENMGRGRSRQEENTPRLNTTCQRPGNIHTACGESRAITTVSISPATMAGRNSSPADRSIVGASVEWARRAREIVSTLIMINDKAAVLTQRARYAAKWCVGSFTHASCAAEAMTANAPVPASVTGP